MNQTLACWALAAHLVAAAPPLAAATPALNAVSTVEIWIEGRLTDGTGEPLAGAEAELLPWRPGTQAPNIQAPDTQTPDTRASDTEAESPRAPGHQASVPRANSATTTPSGTLRLRATAGAWIVRLSKPGHVAADFPLASLSVDRRLPAAVLTRDLGRAVRVVDLSGRPVTGATVTAVPARAGSRADGWRPAPFAGKTDRSGRVSVPWHHHRLRIQSIAPAGAISAPAVLRAHAEAGEETLLVAGRVAYGYLVDNVGAGVENARVALELVSPGSSKRTFSMPDGSSEPGEKGMVRAVTDRDGRFTLAPVGAGRYRLVAEAEGRSVAVVPGLVTPAGVAAWDLGLVEMVAGQRLAGRVLDREGVGIDGARVRVQLDEESQAALPSTGPRIAVTEDGSFELAGLPSAIDLTLTITAEGFRGAEERVTLPRSEPIEIVLELGGFLAGRVVDEGGEPVAEAIVAATGRAGSPASGEPTPGLAAPIHAAVDPDGEFQLSGLPAGPLELRAIAPGAWMDEPVVVEIEDDGEAREVEIVLLRGLTVEGRVATPDGPLAGAEVELFTDHAVADGRRQATTDTAGEFRFRGVPPGSWTLAAHRSGYRPTARKLALAGEPPPVELFLEPGAVVSGVVLAADGSPVAGAALTLEGLGPRPATLDAAFAVPPPAARSDAGGAFQLVGVEPGRYRVIASHPGLAPRRPSPEVTVSDEGTSGLVVEMDAATAIHGRLLGLALEELARAEIVGFCPPATAVEARPDFAGRYQLTDLPACDWRVAARLGARVVAGAVETTGADPLVWLELDFNHAPAAEGAADGAMGGQPPGSAVRHLQAEEGSDPGAELGSDLDSGIEHPR